MSAVSLAPAAGRRLALGVIGHVDHGKTALVRALTGMETDRLPEEKARGVSIVLGFAHARFGPAEVDFIDMPGHERFVRTMISGATGIGAALLVVAANEGIKPQTREHLEIAALLGIGRVLPVATKLDLTTAEEAAEAAAAAAALARELGLACEPGSSVSTLTGEGLDALRRAIGAVARTAVEPADDGFPWLPVDRSFTVEGRGTVATGTLRRGVLSPARGLSIQPGGRAASVRGLQLHGAGVESALPGQRVAVNLRGVEPADIPRGSALSPPGLLAPGDWLSVELQAVRSAPPLRNGARLLLLFGAQEVAARVRLLDRDALEPGARALAQLHTAEPVGVPARERFVLRLPSPAATVAGGRILDPGASRLRRHDSEAQRWLEGLASAGPAQALELGLERAGRRGEARRRLQTLAGVGDAPMQALLQGSGAWPLPHDRWLARDVAEAMAEAVVAGLRSLAETQPAGVARRRLMALLPGASEEALEGVVTALAAAGRVERQEGAVRLPPSRSEAAGRLRQEGERAAALEARLKAAGLQPPDLPALAPDASARRTLERLVRDGQAVLTVDRVQKRELAFHAEAVALAKARLRPRLQPPGLTVGEIGQLLALSRKFSVPLLEYLDTQRFTRRQGDRRTLGPGAAED